MTDVLMPTGAVWRVIGKVQPSQEIAGERFEALKVGENYSVWRTTSPDHSDWAIFVCGEPEDLPEFEGEETEVTDDSARMFCARRLRLAAESWYAGERGDVRQDAHYGPIGGVLRDDGSIIPFSI